MLSLQKQLKLKFEEFGFDSRLNEGIQAIGYLTPTPIQEKTIPIIQSGKDLIGSAQTGTGKTAAFVLPVINHIIHGSNKNTIKALVIVPTRELAIQVDQQVEGFSYYTPVSSIAVYGGTDGISFNREKQSLIDGADIVICTPGRMIAHLNQEYVDLSNLKYLILDEADRMLDMGFFDDIMKILSYMPEKRQNLLFSATMPRMIRELARKILSDPIEINIAVSKPADNILQLAYMLYDAQKVPMAKYILSSEKLSRVLIFCSTKINTKQLARELKSSGLNVEEIHSDIEQTKRENVLTAFKSRIVRILVATDILSRGIDVEDIEMVINYDVPHDAEDYIHRIGRTARAENDGIAVTFINQKEQSKFASIEHFLGNEIHKAVVPVQLGQSPEYNPEKNKRTKRSFRKPNKKTK
jgi:ATP-dependent RNA helicase RhlE